MAATSPRPSVGRDLAASPPVRRAACSPSSGRLSVGRSVRASSRAPRALLAARRRHVSGVRRVSCCLPAASASPSFAAAEPVRRRIYAVAAVAARRRAPSPRPSSRPPATPLAAAQARSPPRVHRPPSPPPRRRLSRADARRRWLSGTAGRAGGGALRALVASRSLRRRPRASHGERQLPVGPHRRRSTASAKTWHVFVDGVGRARVVDDES